MAEGKWITSQYWDDGLWGILSNNNGIIAGVSIGLSKNQADQIVLEHNRIHDALTARVKKLEEALEELITPCPNCFDWNCTKYPKARAVLKKGGE